MSFARALPSIATIRKAVASNSVPVLVTTLAATNVLRIAGNLVLTRILAPEAFGVAGAVIAISVILTMLTDMGYAAFLVRSKRELDKRFIDVIWTIRLARCVVLTAFMAIFAGPLAAAFDKPELKAPITAAAFLFVLEGLRSLHPIIAERQRRISYVMIVEFSVFLVSTALTIAAALVLRSYWALIIGLFAGSAANVAASYLLFPGGRHALSFDKSVARELWLFARVVVASSIITLILGQADKVLVGRTLSLETFGLYMLAASITGAAQRPVQAYVGKVFFPMLAETNRKTPDKLPEVYYASRRRMTLGLAFLLGGVVGGGPLAVRILFDDRYLDAGIFVSLLALLPLFMLVTAPAEQIVIVTGRIRSALEANVFRLAWICVAAPLGTYFYGTLGLVAAFALTEAAASLFWLRRLATIGVLKLKEEAMIFAAAIGGAALGFGFYQLAERMISTGVVPSF